MAEEEWVCVKTSAAIAIAEAVDYALSPVSDEDGLNHMETGGREEVFDYKCAVRWAASAGAVLKQELREEYRTEEIVAPSQIEVEVMCWKRLCYGCLACRGVLAHGSSPHQSSPVNISWAHLQVSVSHPELLPQRQVQREPVHPEACSTTAEQSARVWDCWPWTWLPSVACRPTLRPLSPQSRV